MSTNKKTSRFGYETLYTLLMLAAAIVIIVALCLSGNSDNYSIFNILMAVGCGVYALASVMALIKSIIVLFSKINHRAPEYKRAITITVVTGLILIVSVFGLVWALTLL